MFIRQLRYLSALATERHFGRAALACHVSQPTLSGAIHKLEQELGVIIVLRGQRFEGFTAEGERILLWARRVLADCEALKQAAQIDTHVLHGALNWGCIPTALPLVPFLLEACLQTYSHIHHQVYTLSATEILRKLSAFELDLGISYLDDRQDFEYIALLEEHYVLVAKHADLFQGRQTISWQDAAQLPLCLLTPNMQSRHGIDIAFANAHTKAQPILESDSLTILCSHIQQLGLFSILPHSLLCLDNLANTLAVIPIVPRLQRKIGLVVRAGHPQAPILHAAMQILQKLDAQAHLDALSGQNKAPSNKA